MARSELDALAQTLGLDRHALGTRATVFPGTLVASTPPAPVTPPAPMTTSSLAPPAPRALELVSVLGRGGMGVVWAAKQRALDRVVAVKRLGEPPFGARDASALVTEARTAGGLEHPAIVPVHDLALDADGSPMLVTSVVTVLTAAIVLARTPGSERDDGRRTRAPAALTIERVRSRHETTRCRRSRPLRRSWRSAARRGAEPSVVAPRDRFARHRVGRSRERLTAARVDFADYCALNEGALVPAAPRAAPVAP